MVRLLNARSFDCCRLLRALPKYTSRRNAPRSQHVATLNVTSFHSIPRQFPSSGFDTISSSQDIEEELVPGYVSEAFYPVYIGEVLDERYQVVTKLGRGVGSTVWLARDLQ